LTWDEANLVINEGQRDSTMKITEPKTPFVRYNPETDEVMNLETIPGFELGMAEDDLRSPPGSSGPSSRHSSFSAHSRPSGSRRSSSDSSEKRVDIILDENAQHGGIDPEADDDDDEANMTPEELAKHRQFAHRRGSHYR
jgi:protein phosphatase inhibitor 2